MSAAQGVAGFVANLVGEKSEEEVIGDVTHIHAARYDAGTSAALTGQPAEAHAEWSRAWAVLGLEGLHGFPLWEEEVHDLLQQHFGELQSVFRAYACGTLSADAGTNDQMDLDEFNDFALECVLPTKEYGFNVRRGAAAATQPAAPRAHACNPAHPACSLTCTACNLTHPSLQPDAPQPATRRTPGDGDAVFQELWPVLQRQGARPHCVHAMYRHSTHPV